MTTGERFRESPRAQDLEATEEKVETRAGTSQKGITIETQEQRDGMIFRRQLAVDLPFDYEDTDEPISFDEAKKDDVIKSMLVSYIMGMEETKNRCTPLFWAIVEGNMRNVQRLLRAGADVSNLDGADSTALNVAALFGQLHILKYFLDIFDFQNTPNKIGFYPIHNGVDSGVLDIVKLLLETFGLDQLSFQTRDGLTVWQIMAFSPLSNEHEKYLLQVGSGHRFSLNIANNRGQYPLQMLASFGTEARAARLLRNGAALSVEGGKETAVKPIARTFADPLKIFKEIFDECIYEKNDYVYVDFNILADDSGMNQIKVLEDLANSQSKILKHPMIESLIYLKWSCLLPVFYVILASFARFLVAFNTFVITTFYERDTNNATLCNSTRPSDLPCVGSCSWYSWMSIVFMYISISMLLTQECAWIYLRKLRYFVLAESWLRLSGLALGAAVPALVGCGAAPPAPWQRHVACAALLLAWLQAMLLLARCPGTGHYLLMFEKILVTSICLVIALSTCFMIYYQSQPPFDGPFSAFVKTLVMMTSEFDYEDLFGEDHDAQLSGTRTVVRILFVTFVILVAIVLMNLIIGVAVSDISELTAIGNIRRLEKRVELLSTLEGLVDTVVGRWCRRLSRLRYHSDMCNNVMEDCRTWTLKYRDGEKCSKQFEQSLTKEIHDAIYDVAKKNKQKTQSHVVTPHSTFPDAVTILDKVRSIEDDNRKLLLANQEMKASIDALKNDASKILSALEGMSSTKVFKAWPRERKFKKKLRNITKQL